MSSIKLNSWIVFTNRVRALLKANGYTGLDVATKANQFCSHCKSQTKEYAALTDSQILDMRSTWDAPEVSKQEAAGHHFKNKQRQPNLVKEAAAEAGDEEAEAWVERYYARQQSISVTKQRERKEAEEAAWASNVSKCKQIKASLAAFEALLRTLPPDVKDDHPLLPVIVGLWKSIEVSLKEWLEFHSQYLP
jgi:hypothetical protein